MPGNGIRVWLLRCAGYSVGSDVYVGDSLIIIDQDGEADTVTIGDRVAIAARVTLVTLSEPGNSVIRTFSPVAAGPITVGDDAWLGTGAIVLPNVVIGHGAVVGAGSVVTKRRAPTHCGRR